MTDNSRLSASSWKLISHELFHSNKAWITPPEKLFLWNSKGIYLDYHYPNPIHGHYVGGEQLLGKRISAVLPPPMANGVRSAVLHTITAQQPLVERYELTLHEQLYQIIVRFLPFQNLALGVVNDYPIESKENTLEYISRE